MPAHISRSVQNSDIVDRLKAAAEQDDSILAAEAQALFLEAADTIELLRSLLEPLTEGGLQEMAPKGQA